MLKLNFKGFTLIEVVLFIFILGIILSLIIPNIKIIKDLRIKFKFLRLRKDIIKYRNKSLIEKKSYKIIFMRSRNKYRISKMVDGNEIIYLERKLGDDLKITKGDIVKLMSSGVTDKAKTIVFESYDKCYNLTLTPVTFRINIKDD